MTTVWPSRRLRFGRSRRTRRGSDDGMEKAPPTVRRGGRVPPPRAGLPCRFQFFWNRGRGVPFCVPMPGVGPGAVPSLSGFWRKRRRFGMKGPAVGHGLGVAPPRGRRSSRRDGSRRDVVSDGRQSLSSACGALRRRETAMRAAPPPSTTTAASAISAMPAPVWARLLR